MRSYLVVMDETEEALAGVEVHDHHDERCEHMMADFIEKNPSLWNEDIGE